MAKIKTKRERVKFASDNVAGACPEVLDAIIKANDGDSTPYGNDQISTELQDKFSEIFEKEVIVFPTASGTAAISAPTGTFATSAKDSSQASAVTSVTASGHTHGLTVPSSVMNFIIKI